MELSRNPQQTQNLWTELFFGFGRRKSADKQNCLDTAEATSIIRSSEIRVNYADLDDRTARMLSVFTRQSFNDARNHQQMRMLLISWVIRNKIKDGLKRGLDLAVCLTVFPFLLPLLILTSLAIKIDTPGPIFFKQKRVGKWGKPFICYKFRSMFVDAEARKAELMHLNEADAIVFKIAKDPRVTRVGRFIRKLSIDEVPQILNVIRGDMSLVGPRPPVPYEVANYEYEHMRRLNATPGITGLQQVSGRSTLNFDRWIELDLKYIQEQCLAKDIEILVKTIPAVISGKGAC